MHQCIKFILFWNDTLHVSDGLSVHHQQFKTIRTVTGLLAGTRCSISYPLASSQQYLFDIRLLLYVQSLAADDGRKDGPKHVQCHFKMK